MKFFAPKFKKKLPALIFIFSLLGLSAFFYFSSTDALISWIGVKNAYLLIFILGLIGGLTTFSGVPYQLVLVTLAAGGLNPWILGICTGMGVVLGDCTSYFIGSRSSELLSGRIYNFLQKIVDRASKHPKLLPLFFLFYACFVPLSNDFIVISAGVVRYPFWKVMTPLAIGNVFFNIALAMLAAHGSDLVHALS